MLLPAGTFNFLRLFFSLGSVSYTHLDVYKRQVVLIVDNCPAQLSDVELTAVKLVFLPPNTTSVLQPCDQGIIPVSYTHLDVYKRQT